MIFCSSQCFYVYSRIKKIKLRSLGSTVPVFLYYTYKDIYNFSSEGLLWPHLVDKTVALGISDDAGIFFFILRIYMYFGEMLTMWLLVA